MACVCGQGADEYQLICVEPAPRFGWDDWEDEVVVCHDFGKAGSIGIRVWGARRAHSESSGRSCLLRPAAPQQARPARRPAAAGHSGNVVSLCFALSWRLLRRLARRATVACATGIVKPPYSTYI